MFRDKGPIHNIGHGVTSRDMPSREGETETPSPNSGYVARALDQHPVMRFFASAGTAMVVTTLASRFARGAGLRLGKSLQNASDTALRAGRTDALPTRVSRAILDAREAFDELGGISRTIDGVDDPYSKIIHEVDGKLTTGYDPKTGGRFFRRPISPDGRRTTNLGRTSESAEVWTLRDDIQIRMVKLARRLPYELPALYVTQRAVTDPLFAGEQEKPRIKWYNPADVISDFVKQSTLNLATMMLPFEAVGAAGNAGRSSLTTLASSMSDLRALSPMQMRAANAAVDLRSLLAEVGQDLSDMTSKMLKISSQTSGAFSAGVQEIKNAQPEFVQALRAARHGAAQAAQDLSDRDKSKRLKILTARARGFFTGTTEDGIGVLDTLPTFKGARAGSIVAKNQFKSLGVAHDVVSGKLSTQGAQGVLAQKFGFNSREALDDALQNNSLKLKFMGLTGTDSESILNNAIRTIQGQHSSGITKISEAYFRLGRGGPDSDTFKSSEFYRRQVDDEYKKQVEKHLIKVQNVDEDLAKRFVNNLKIEFTPSKKELSDISNRISLGRRAIYDDIYEVGGDNSDNFFKTILDKFETIKGGKAFRDSLNMSRDGVILKDADALKAAFDDVDFMFRSEEFRKNLQYKIAGNWNKIRTAYMPQAAADTLKPAKQSYLDFIGRNLSEEKQTYLIRRTAQTLGINLTDDAGRQQSMNFLGRELAKRSIDPTDFEYMRDFLLDQRKLSTGFFSGGTNIFGLKPVLVDEAFDRGMFKNLPEEQQAAIREIASSQAVFDPVTGGLGAATETMGRNVVGGMYKTRSGDILDFNQVKNVLTRAKDFIASDFRVPIVGFNPADLLGNRSLSDIRRSPVLQYVSSRSVQPFMPAADDATQFYLLNRTRGTKGSLTAFREEGGKLTLNRLPGFYRPISSSSTEIFSREARNATNMAGERVDVISSRESGRQIRFGRIKSLFDIDPEQPNSLFRLAGRFRNRNTDIRNNRVISQILSAEDNTITYRQGTRQRSLRLDRQNLNIVDEAGDVRYKTSEVLSAVESFRKRTFGYSMNPKVMKALEDLDTGLFRAGNVRATEAGQTVDNFRDALRTLRIRNGLR